MIIMMGAKHNAPLSPDTTERLDMEEHLHLSRQQQIQRQTKESANWNHKNSLHHNKEPQDVRPSQEPVFRPKEPLINSMNGI